jgi:hypothetical protein
VASQRPGQARAGQEGQHMLNLKIIIGSTRPGRAADRVIPWINALSGQHGAFRAAEQLAATGHQR